MKQFFFRSHPKHFQKVKILYNLKMSGKTPCNRLNALCKNTQIYIFTLHRRVTQVAMTDLDFQTAWNTIRSSKRKWHLFRYLTSLPSTAVSKLSISTNWKITLGRVHHCNPVRKVLRWTQFFINLLSPFKLAYAIFTNLWYRCNLSMVVGRGFRIIIAAEWHQTRHKR